MNLAENREQETFPPAPTETLAQAAPAPAEALTKNPLLAAFLSLFPGMGLIYDGLYLRGLTFFFIIMGLINLAQAEGREVLGFAVAFFWLFNVLDAYRQATLINLGYARDLGIADLPRRPQRGQGGLAAGIVLFAVGLVNTLDRFFVVDLDWVFDLWPVALMLLGAWLVWGAFQERRREREA